MNSKDYDKMTVVVLRDELKTRGLSIEGKKAELVDRLKAADKTAEEEILDTTVDSAAVNPAAVEDLLNDDVLLGDSDTPPKSEENTLSSKKLEGEPSNENGASGNAPAQEQKSDSGKKASELVSTEAKLARAARFGLPVGATPVAVLGTTTNDAKARRAERFGLDFATDSPAASVPGSLTSEEAKAKRLARFGSATTSVTAVAHSKPGVVDDATKEKLLKRAQRFGLPINSEGKVVAPAAAELDEKKKARLERFGGSATTA